MSAPTRHDSSLAMYIIGFVSSVGLTLAAYLAVTLKLLSDGELIAAIVGLAVLQVLVQLFFFLHLGHETKPRWKLAVLGFMLAVLGIVVIGTLWIMQNLNYHMMPMTESEKDSYMLKQKDKGF